MAHHFILLQLNPFDLIVLNPFDLSADGEGWWFEYLCHGSGFDYKQRALKTFPSPDGYLRS